MKTQTTEREIRHGCIFSSDLFNLRCKTILSELENLSGFIIGGYNLNLIIRYVDDTVLMADSEKKLKENQEERTNY